MSEKPSKKRGCFLDKGAVQGAIPGTILLLIIAVAALALGDESVDSPQAVILAVVVTGIGLLSLLAIRWLVRAIRSRRVSGSQVHDVVQHEPPVSDKPFSPRVPGTKHVQAKIEETLKKHAVVDHEKLFGVNELLNGIREYLLNPRESWIVSLFGEGGVGKTALAYEVVQRYAAEAGFTRFAWVSAKQRYFFATSEIRRPQDSELQWADLVRQVADQLDLEMGYSRAAWLTDFRQNIQQLPENDKCLIVIDNLETVEDASVIDYFDDPQTPEARIIEPHKVIITTRKSILAHSSSVIEIPIRGLKSHSAYQLIRFLGRGNSAIASVDDEKLRPILDITEGNPFLIKLVVRRFLVSRKPINLVLQELRELNSAGIAKQVKDYLYVQSLKELEQTVGEEVASQLMNAFCPRVAGELLLYEQLRRYSGIADEELFAGTLRLACDLSLIRVSGLNRMYSIHSLLWEFICKDN